MAAGMPATVGREARNWGAIGSVTGTGKVIPDPQFSLIRLASAGADIASTLGGRAGNTEQECRDSLRENKHGGASIASIARFESPTR